MHARILSALLLLGLFSIYCPNIRADDFFDSIDIGDSSSSHMTKTSLFKGFYQQKLKYGISQPEAPEFDRRKAALDQIQSDIYLEFNTDISDTWKLRLASKAELDIIQWDDNTQDTKLNHQKLLLKDAYLDAQFDNGLWLRAGHQVFAWGESENLSISDVLSPSDLREFGQAELQDIREQVPAIMLSRKALGGRLTAVSTYRAGHDRLADDDESFYPYGALKSQGLTIEEKTADSQWEFALKYDHSFNGGDLSLVLADINDNGLSVQSLDTETGELQLGQERVSVFATSLNRAVGRWLVKAELGHYWNQVLADNSVNPIEENQVRAMLGFEYSGWNNWRISYEANGLKAVDSDMAEEIDASVAEMGQVFRINHNALNEKLTQQLWFIDLIQDNGAVIRYDLSYDLNDSWGLSAAVVLYEVTRNDSQLYSFRHHDTINLSAKYSF